MTAQISMLEGAVQRLHVRLQQQIRALYVLHANGNDELAAVVLERIETLNTKIAELHALLDSYEVAPEPKPAQTGAELVERLSATPLESVTITAVDAPSDVAEEDVEEEYRNSVYGVVLLLLIVGVLMFCFKPLLTSLVDSFHHEPVQVSSVPSVAEPVEPATPPVVVETVKVTEMTYVVQEGDSLWKIAQQISGDPSYWTTIYGQNAEVIGDNPDLIFPGQVLTISTITSLKEPL